MVWTFNLKPVLLHLLAAQKKRLQLATFPRWLSRTTCEMEVLPASPAGHGSFRLPQRKVACSRAPTQGQNSWKQLGLICKCDPTDGVLVALTLVCF